MADRDFKDDVRVDKFNLHIDCEEHPSNYLYWAEQLAEAKSELDNAKDKLKLIEAEQEEFYRISPKGGRKITEGSIKAIIETDEKVIEAKKELREAHKDVHILSAAVSALEHKKTQLTNLKDLWIKGYYADPEGQRTSTDQKENDLRNGLNKKNKEE